jgi:hypothetical protein
MSNPLRLNPELIAAAERASLLQKRSIPKQIEFWASIGKAVENVIDYSDIFAILQGVEANPHRAGGQRSSRMSGRFRRP